MEKHHELLKSLQKSCIWLLGLTIIYVFSFCKSQSAFEIYSSLPFFVVFYFLFFNVGQPKVIETMRQWFVGRVQRAILFPLLLLLLFAIYLVINGQNPFGNLLALFPFFLFFPVLAYSSDASARLNWFDFFVFTAFLLPTTLINIQPKGDLPFNGDGFDSVYRISIMLVAVFAYGVLRKIDDIGFFPEISLKKLFTSVWVWAAFYISVLLIGVSVDFVKLVGYSERLEVMVPKILLALVTGFLHTAIFEELFFRGLLQNLLAKKIGQNHSWKLFLWIGLVVLLPMALIVGYTLKGGMQWFPALVTILIFAFAYWLEFKNKASVGLYSAMAITSTLFGLVHYHSGSIIYIGFACIAGWAYGYVYYKTQSVFYSAVTHALVGASALILGLSLVK